MILEQFHARTQQMQDLLATMNKLAHFRPKAHGPGEAAQLLELSTAEYENSMPPALSALDAATSRLREQKRSATELLHNVVETMKARYRKNPAVTLALEQLRHDGPIPAAAQMQELSLLWAKLPVPPDAPLGAMAFTPSQEMNRALFDQVRSDLLAAEHEFDRAQCILNEAETRLQERERQMAGFIAHVLEEGGRFFGAETSERAALNIVRDGGGACCAA